MNELSIESLNKKIENLTAEIGSIRKDLNDTKEIGHKNRWAIRIIEEEYPLLPPEADDLSKAVKKKGVHLMGGKSSAAYQNADLRKQVYRDIYGEIKRQYGLINERGGQLSYKKLKRKYLPGAFMVVENYILPTSLEEAIQEENDLEDVL